jgi:hypothetical protein
MGFGRSGGPEAGTGVSKTRFSAQTVDAQGESDEPSVPNARIKMTFVRIKMVSVRVKIVFVRI